MKKITLILISCLIPLAVFMSCASKRDRLVVDTLVIAIDHSSAQTVAPGGTLALKVICKSAKSDNVDISPSWSVQNSLGSFNPSSGKSTTFTAGTSTGTGKIYATYGSVRGEVGIIVNSSGGGGGGGGAGSLIFYDDSGIVNTFGIPDIFIWSAGGTTGITSSEPSDSNGAPGDTLKYQRFTSTNAWFGGGIVINKVGITPTAADLSAYSSGKSLKFYIKLSRALTGTENIKVEIEHTLLTTKATINLSPTYGFDKTSTSWQQVTISLASFSLVDYSKILLPFEITAENVASPLTFDWDYVRWSP